MSNPALIPVQFYSWNPLPDSIRSTFELPAWPYSNRDRSLPREVLDYFNHYSIWYYRDSLPDGEGGARPALFGTYLGKPLSEVKYPIDCFCHSCYIHYASMEFNIARWWPNCSQEFIEQQVAIAGDNFAWNTFNDQRKLKAFGRFSIAFEKKVRERRGSKSIGSFSNLPTRKK